MTRQFLDCSGKQPVATTPPGRGTLRGRHVYLVSETQRFV